MNTFRPVYFLPAAAFILYSGNNRHRDPKKTARLIRALNEGRGDDEILWDPLSAGYAIEAYRQGRISLSQLATVSLIWGVAVDAPPVAVEALPVFENGGVSEKARQLIQGRDQAAYLRSLSELRRLPPSERFIWLFKYKDESPYGRQSTRQLDFQLIAEVGRTNFGLEFDKGNMIPVYSFGFLQARLDARNWSHAT